MKITFTNIFVILSILFLIYPSIKTTLNYDKPTAEDWDRHVVWIQKYISCDFSPIFEYPPLFHASMIPFVYFFASSIKYFQIMFCILATLSISYFVYKTHGKEAMIIVNIFLLISLSYIQYSFTLTPQVLDYILFPLIVLAFFKDKYSLASAGLLMLIYNHLFGIIFFLIMLAYSLLWKRKFLKYLILILILSLPIIYVYYLPAFISTVYNSLFLKGSLIVGLNKTSNFTETGQIWQTEWDNQFVYPIQNFFIFSGFMAWLMLPVAIYKLYKQKFKLDEIQKFYIVWLLFFVPVFIFNVWRTMSYLIIPFILLEASILIKREESASIKENSY